MIGALWEQLLLAQAVYQVATSPPEWEKVSSIFSSHPFEAESRHKSPFTPEECEKAWRALMLAHNIVEAGDATTPRSDRKAQLALAQKLYAARLGELHQQISEKETKFRYVSGLPSRLHQQLEDLESGKLDNKIREANRLDADSSPQRKRRAADTEPSADDEDEADEHLQVEQDLLGGDTPSDAQVPETPEHQERTPSAQPSTTYKSRVRRRAESQSRHAEPTHTPSPPLGTRRLRAGSPEGSELSASEEPSEAVSDAERDKTRRRTTQILLMLHNQVSNHTHGNLFHQAIKEVDAPDYYTLIKQPMDLKLIKQRIKEGTIASALDLRRALNLMFANALMYNRPDTDVYRMANEMRLATDEMLDQFEHTP